MKIEYKTYDKNIDEFADKLMQLFKDKQLLQHEKNLAIAHFNATLDWDTRSEKLNQIYNSLIQKNEK
jgi:glycosyltransferase involved in cell wall biosynthesis